MIGKKKYARDPLTGKYRWYSPNETAPVNIHNDAHNMRSASAGVAVEQIPAMMAAHPDHKYCPVTGDMIFKNRQHRLKCLKDIGMHCQNEVSGGPSR